MLYCLATGYLYTATGNSLSSWTNAELETAGVTDVSVGILGNGCTHVLYAKSSLFERTDNSAYSGTNETKLMKSGMGIIQVSQDIAGTYYTLADGNVLRPGNASHPVGETLVQYPGTITPATLYGGTWENTSYKYAGMFFRAEGGGADTFERYLTIDTTKANTTLTQFFTTAHNLVIGSPIVSSTGELRFVSVVNSTTQITVDPPYSTIPTGAMIPGQCSTTINNFVNSGFQLTLANMDGSAGLTTILAYGGYTSYQNGYNFKLHPDNMTIRFWTRSA